MRPAKHPTSDPDVGSIDNYDTFEQVPDQGRLVAYQDRDSAGSGTGSGRVSVYEYEGAFYVSHGAGIDGPYKSKSYAIQSFGIARIDGATVAVWDSEKGFAYQR